MRFLVAGARSRANGALFNTMDTVAGENPLCVATSRMVTAAFLPLGRFTGRLTSAGSIILLDSPNLQCPPHPEAPIQRAPQTTAVLETISSSKPRKRSPQSSRCCQQSLLACSEIPTKQQQL